MGNSTRRQQEFPAQQAAALGIKQVFDIPLTADLEKLTLALSGSVTLSGAATSLYKDGILELIKSIDLVKDGSETLVSLPFSQIVKGNMFRRRHRPVPTITQPGLTVAAQPFAAYGVLDLAAFGALKRKETLVRETDARTLQLIVTWASDFTGVFNGGTVTLASTVLSLIVKADEVLELPDATGKMTSPIFKPLFTYREDQVPAATARQRFRLTPDQALRGLGLRVVNPATSVCSDSLLSVVRLFVGNNLRFTLSAAAIKASNMTEMVGGTDTGYYFIDLAEHGSSADRLNDCYNLFREVMNGADAYLEYDTLGAAVLGVSQYGYQKRGG